jgi:hypothetical protein
MLDPGDDEQFLFDLLAYVAWPFDGEHAPKVETTGDLGGVLTFRSVGPPALRRWRAAGLSAQAGLFGGGGLGDFAVTYGSQRYNWPVVYITVATIIAIVQAGQFLGNTLARRALRR